MPIAAAMVLLAAGCSKDAPTLQARQSKDSVKTANFGFHLYPEWLQTPIATPVLRKNAIGFSIGSKGYMGGGEGYYPGGIPDYASSLNDFWQFDPSINTWTQAANLPMPLSRAATFVIGTQGYVCTGYSDNPNGYTLLNTLYRYDQASNTWTQKATFPGPGRCDAVGTNIGNYGYVGTGSPLIHPYYSDWWEYDPSADHWYRRADLPGTWGRAAASSFSIGLYGFITCGEIYTIGLANDLWAYDPYYDHWQQEASLPASARMYATGFNYQSYGALIGGQAWQGNTIYLTDFWYYDINSNTWTSNLSLSFGGRCKAVGFTINNAPYIGTGETDDGSFGKFNNDFWYMTYVFH